MSKINVNPNHYKVAGRERQGEDIVQEWHRQKHTQNLALERFERPRATSPAPVKARRAAFAPGLAPAAGAESTSKRPSTANATTKRAAAPGSSAKRTPVRARSVGSKSAVKSDRAAAAAPAKQPGARRAVGTNVQGSDKRGKRSTAQKRASSRNDFKAMPATRPVAGAHGREPSRRPRGTKKR